MSRDKPFVLHPLLKEAYAQLRGVLSKEDGWTTYPASLGEIKQVLRVDFAYNEGEGHAGAVRVFAAGAAFPGDARIFEMIFYPLTGRISWAAYRGGEAYVASSGDEAISMLWPAYQATVYAALRFAELLDAGKEPGGHGAADEILNLVASRPDGLRYRQFTLTAAKTLVRLRKASLAVTAPLEMEEGAWYAVSRQHPCHERRLEPLEIFVGRAFKSLHDWYLEEDDDLRIEIEHQGRGDATIEWNPTVVRIGPDLQAKTPAPPDRLKFLNEGRGSWAFRLDAKFAESLKRFATPKLPDGHAILRELRADRAPASE